ncbi:D-glycero-beta-D-manno-heptose-7-phosphate kinase [Burkholderia cepacia]|nr:D-glycero-beta-D-manno-heptose-7-phosphate kinase [Burkholderia cepacia]
MHKPQPANAIRPRILVVGDIMLDRYVIGGVSRISPEAPVPVLAVGREENRPGGAANVAANVSAMGGDATLLAVVGHDSASIELQKCLQEYGVRTLFVSDPEGGTTQKTRLMAGVQQIARVDRDVRPTARTQALLLEEFRRVASEHDLIVLSDYAKGTLDHLPEFLAVAAALNVPTLVDPKRTDPAFYRGATLLKPNNSEFIGLFGNYTSDDELLERAQQVLAELNLRHLVVTRGSKGMVYVSKDGQPGSIPTHARDVFDVSGAGDTVLSALALALARGTSVSEAVHIANVAAGIAVSHSGTYVVSADEVRDQLYPSRQHAPKLVDEETLGKLLLTHRQRGESIVFTNGCFDTLNPGHIRFLNEARAQGDILVVGLNSDASVHALNGSGHPGNPFAYRAEVLAGLAAVDYVVAFDAPTPLQLIESVEPDVLVQGSDEEVQDIVGHDAVSARGGRVVALALGDGDSTTRVVQQISAVRDQ